MLQTTCIFAVALGLWMRWLFERRTSTSSIDKVNSMNMYQVIHTMGCQSSWAPHGEISFELQTCDYITLKDYLSLLQALYSNNALCFPCLKLHLDITYYEREIKGMVYAGKAHFYFESWWFNCYHIYNVLCNSIALEMLILC